MHAHRLSDQPAFDGTSALSLAPRRLVLLEGGLGSDGPVRSERPRARCSARPVPSLCQSLMLVGLAALTVLAIALVSLVSDALSAARISDALDSLATETVTVHEGDTLWGIASERAPEGVSTADLVSWIKRTNALDGGLIVSGQQLEVPVSVSSE